MTSLIEYKKGWEEDFARWFGIWGRLASKSGQPSIRLIWKGVFGGLQGRRQFPTARSMSWIESTPKTRICPTRQRQIQSDKCESSSKRATLCNYFIPCKPTSSLPSPFIHPRPILHFSHPTTITPPLLLLVLPRQHRCHPFLKFFLGIRRASAILLMPKYHSAPPPAISATLTTCSVAMFNASSASMAPLTLRAWA